MASEETENGSENNLTITFPSNTSHKSLSTELLATRLSYHCTKNFSLTHKVIPHKVTKSDVCMNRILLQICLDKTLL